MLRVRSMAVLFGLVFLAVGMCGPIEEATYEVIPFRFIAGDEKPCQILSRKANMSIQQLVLTF